MATVVPTVGKGLITSTMAALSLYGAWGTGAGSAGAGSTGVSTESTDEARSATTNTQQTTSTTNDTLQMVWTQTCATSNKTITNAGVLNAASTGTCLIVTDGVSTALTVGDSITFTLKIALS